MTFHVFRKVSKTKMILRLQNSTARLCYRQLSSMSIKGSLEHCNSQSKPLTFSDPSTISTVVKSVASVNPRLSALSLNAQYLSGRSLLQPTTSPLKVHLPTASGPKVVSCPTLESLSVKKFIVEENLKRVEEPAAGVVNKPKIEEPVVGGRPTVEKWAIRMIVNRRIKMKKHQRKKLWQRMGLRFRADRVVREKKKELEFRAILAAKVILQICIWHHSKLTQILYMAIILNWHVKVIHVH